MGEKDWKGYSAELSIGFYINFLLFFFISLFPVSSPFFPFSTIEESLFSLTLFNYLLKIIVYVFTGEVPELLLRFLLWNGDVSSIIFKIEFLFLLGNYLETDSIYFEKILDASPLFSYILKWIWFLSLNSFKSIPNKSG